jgi:inositol-phosphate phosphatase / L-galactose 1-phosphate phosphatase / histidinol-phosphatase
VSAREAVPAPFVDLARRLTEVSRPILKRYYRQKLEIIDKADESPVTKADRECEAALREKITAAFPDHGIIGEEFGAERGDAEYVWVLDPLDGTRSFITGRPLFGTLIALTRGGRPILGVIDMPVLGDLWLGASGQPTTLNGAPVAARACSGLADAYLSTVSPQVFDAATFPHFEALRAKAKSTTYGGDCYQYAMVATGFLDLVIERGLGIYDYLALVPVIEGAGGAITDWHGGALTMQSTGAVVAAGDRRVLDQAVATLGG